MADLIALIYAEGNIPPIKAIETLRASGCCSKISLSGFGPGQLPDQEADLEIFPASEVWQEAANRIARQADTDCLLLLISSLSGFSGYTIQNLIAGLKKNPEIAGANPVFMTGDRAHISWLGTVVDSLGYLHYLYEGLPRGHWLAKKERSFQLGHPGLLLVRCSDIQKQGGFRNNELSFFGFCKDLTASRPGGFAVIPQAEAIYENRTWQLRILGIINSLNMRTKLRPGTFRPDYFEKVIADGLEYGINEWLQEGPAGIDLYDKADAWFRWRNDSRPETMLAWLAGIEARNAAAFLNLIREYPCYLPAQFRWYEVMASRKLAYAQEHDIESMAGQIRAWQKRSGTFHYGQLRKGMTLLKNAGVYNSSLDHCPAVYDVWLELAPDARPARIKIGCDWPKIAVAMPVYNPNHSFFRQAVESVRCQTYQNWQLCMADDASTDPEIRPMLEALANEDKRIRVDFRSENGHISRATNSALELVDAPWTAFMDNDDLISEDALAELAKVAASHKDLRLIFSDFDHIDAENVRRNPVFKPDHDFDHNFVEHLACYETSLLRELSGLRPGVEGAQDKDLSLRAIEKTKPWQINHIARILYHWRVHAGSTAGSLQAKPYAREATRKVFTAALERRRLPANVVESEGREFYRIAYKDDLSASWALIIIGGKDPELPMKHRSLEELRSTGRAKFYWLPERGGLTEERWSSESEIGILQECGLETDGWLRIAEGVKEDVILFLAGNMLAEKDCRPEQLLIQAQRSDISAVGSLIFCNRFLYNGGYYPDVDGNLFPLLQGADFHDLINYCWGLFAMPHPAIAPSPLCFAMRREMIGAFLDSDLSGPYALTEFCLEQALKGRKVLISPWGQWQLMGNPRQEPVLEAEKQRFSEKWGKIITYSGLRNPNLRAAPDNDWTLILPD